MRTHPFVFPLTAMLLCAGLTACSDQADNPQEPGEPPLEADAAPQGEADNSEPPAEDTDDDAREVPLGWAAHPQEQKGNGEDIEEDEDVDAPVDTVTGGGDGETVTASDADELAEHLASEEPLIVEVNGDVDLDGDVHVASDTTLVGDEAVLSGGRLVVDGAHNVILSGMEIEADDTAVAVRGDAHHVWVHGSTFTGGEEGPLVSITDGADHVTLSWTHFREATSALDIGGGDDEPGALRVTVHHNFFDGTSSRHPRVRSAEHVHVFNNYFRSNDEYGVRSAHEANVLVEGNYFESTTLSVSTEEGEPGNAVARDNLLVDSEQPETRGNVSDPPYTYELDGTAEIPELVRARAGAML